MLMVVRSVAAVLLAVVVVALPGVAPSAHADVAAGGPPLSVGGTDYRYHSVDGVQWLQRLTGNTWSGVAPSLANPGPLVSFAGTLYTDGTSAGAGAGQAAVYRLSDGQFTQVPDSPTGVLDVFIFADALYSATADGWWKSADGDSWTLVAGSPGNAVDPADYAGSLYVRGTDPADPSASAQLYRFDGSSFTPVPAAPNGMISPAVAGGLLYFRDGWGGLWDFDGSRFRALNDSTYSPVVLGPVEVHDHVYFVEGSQDPYTALMRLAPIDMLQGGLLEQFTQLVAVDDTVWWRVTDLNTSTTTWNSWREPLVPGTVTVAGDVKLGSTLTAVTSDWPAGTTFTYRWTRNGLPIPTATGRQYRLRGDDDYAALDVRVTGTVAGYDQPAATVDAGVPSVLRPSTFQRIPLPVVSGTMRQGHLLHAVVPSWTPRQTISTYQWLRDGRNIANAYGSSYRLTKADRHRSISVRIVGFRDGYTSAEATSHGRRVS